MKLDDIQKHNIYKVPEGYFDRLPNRVMEQTAAKGTSASPVFGSLWRPMRLALVPLVMLLILAGVYLSQMNMPQYLQPAYVSLATLPDDEIMAYLDNYGSLQTSDFEELNLADKELTAEFINISSETAEAELEFYKLNDLIY